MAITTMSTTIPTTTTTTTIPRLKIQQQRKLQFFIMILISMVGYYIMYLKIDFKFDIDNEAAEATASAAATVSSAALLPDNAHNHKNNIDIINIQTIKQLLKQHEEYVLPQALQVLEQYKQWHSVTALQNEYQNNNHNNNNTNNNNTNISNRSFVIGYYSCPNQAGNRLHHFFNSLLWAIVTNRTLLWNYYDQSSCQQFNEKYEQAICDHANIVQDCDEILQRSSWIPSFEEWNTKLGLLSLQSTTSNNDNEQQKQQQQLSPTVIHFWSTHPYVKVTKKDVAAGKYTGTHMVGSRWYPWKKEYLPLVGIDDDLVISKIVQFNNDNQSPNGNSTTNTTINTTTNTTTISTTSSATGRVIILPIMPAKYTDLSYARHRQYLLKHSWSRDIAQKLYSQGANFMYGMFFRHCFRILVDDENENENQNNNNNNSNHDDGKNVTSSRNLITNSFPTTTTTMTTSPLNNNNHHDHDNSYFLNDDTTIKILNKLLASSLSSSSLSPPTRPSSSPSSSTSFSIALHSRHKHAYNNGNDISKEKACLETLLHDWTSRNNYTNSNKDTSFSRNLSILQQQQKQQQQHMSSSLSSTTTIPTCNIYLMSDRNLTLWNLKQWIESTTYYYYYDNNVTTATTTESSYNNQLLVPQQQYQSSSLFFSCHAIIANHDTGTSFRDEHGPFSGKGFFQDLHVASHARNGFVGMRRSSSDLVLELMEYDRYMEAILNEIFVSLVSSISVSSSSLSLSLLDATFNKTRAMGQRNVVKELPYCVL